MTASQQNYIAALASKLGHKGDYGWAHAAAAVLGISSSKISRKGLTKAEASKVIVALKAG
jgi:hypothetical protein